MNKLLGALLISCGILMVTGLSSSAQKEGQDCSFTFEGQTYYGTMISFYCEQDSLKWGVSYRHAPDSYFQYVFTANNAGMEQDWDTAIINAKRALNVFPDDYNAKIILIAAINSKKIQQGKAKFNFNNIDLVPIDFWNMLTGLHINCLEGCRSQEG